jgi:hypothetical protein
MRGPVVTDGDGAMTVMGLYVAPLLIQGVVRRAALLGLYSQNRLESSDGWLSLATNAERLKITTLIINYLFID